METINFKFKPFNPDTLATPMIDIVLHYKGKRGRNLICIVDSGADMTTIPIYIGMEMGIKFNNNRPDLKKDWIEILNKVSSGISCDYSSFLKTLYDNEFHIETEYVCACGKDDNKACLFPVDIEIDGHKFLTMVNWVKDDVSALLGRFGIFDKVKEVVFNKKELKGHFSID